MKKLLSLGLALCLMLSCLAFPALAEDSALTPNADGVYEIGNADQLYQFAALVNGGESAANAVLTADIVLNENVLKENGELNTGDFRAWTPIVGYKGSFNGQGHTVSGVYINEPTTKDRGFFANITGYKASISNLKLTDSYICGSIDVAGIVGDINKGTVSGCSFSGFVTGSTYVGGIAGYAVSGEIKDCVSAGIITGGAVGGIVGSISGVPVSGCSNSATVTGKKAGGIVGSNDASTIESCSNSGTISGEDTVGGIAGYSQYSGPHYGRNYPEIKNCSNSGSISGTTGIGGIAGQLKGPAHGCSNTGTVTGTGSMVGGIAGTASSVHDSCNSGSVTGTSSVGGIVGTGASDGFSSDGYVYRSWNTADVKGTTNVGGIAGSKISVRESYNQGNVTGGTESSTTGASVGGIVGYGDAENCYNIGTLIISGYGGKIGGIIGEVYNAKYVSNNYYLVGSAPFGMAKKDVPGQAEPKTLQQFASGEICYLLQAETDDPLWGQNLDNGQPVQDYPVLSDATVYPAAGKTCDGKDYTWPEGEAAYSNSEDTVITVHTYRKGACTACGAAQEGYIPYIRLAGSNRFDTAIKVADELKKVLGIEKFDAVILANGYNFADALAGSYLSTVKDAPILLTWNGAEKYNYLNDATIEYVKANLKPGGTVYILGGTSAVPKSIDEALSGFTIKRMDGANRFETNIMILREAGVAEGSEVLVCTSTNFADSLSASAAGKPILLVWNEGGKLFDNQISYLKGLKNCTFTVIGGESAVSAKMFDIIRGYGSTTRLAGANRFVTSVMVAEKYFPDATSAVLAYAWDFPDGLCGGGLANAMGAPLILTMTKYESEAAEYIAAKGGFDYSVVLGGEGLISEGSVHLILDLIGEE